MPKKTAATEGPDIEPEAETDTQMVESTHVKQAAYDALASFVPLAQVRNVVAECATEILVDRRSRLGPGHMLMLVGSAPRRRPIVDEVARSLPESFTTVTTSGIDAAVKAAARVLWDDLPNSTSP
jgi:hypothetical protein